MLNSYWSAKLCPPSQTRTLTSGFRLGAAARSPPQRARRVWHHRHRWQAALLAHDFRRVFTTDAILNGMPPHVAQLILGHEDINTTMSRQKPSSTRTSSAITRRSSTGAARPGRPTSTGPPPSPSGSGSKNTSTSARSNWADAPAPTGPLPARARLPEMPHDQYKSENAAPPRRDRRRPPGPPEPSRTRGLARGNRGNRPHPHLPPPERDQTRRLARIAPTDLGMPGLLSAEPP